MGDDLRIWGMFGIINLLCLTSLGLAQEEVDDSGPSIPAPTESSAEQPLSEMVRASGSSRIDNLRWKSRFPVIHTTSATKELATSATLVGKYDRPEWTLATENQKVPLSNKGVFKLVIPIQSAETRLELIAIGPRGEIERESFRILFPKYEQYMQAKREKPVKRHYLSPGVSFTFIDYTDSRTNKGRTLFRDTNLTQSALTAKITYRYLLVPPRWDLAASVFMTALPLKTSITPSARFLGVNFRGGYQLPGVRLPWVFSIFAGVYYQTMFVSGNAYGFSDVAGPQIFPVVQYYLNGGSSILGYAKFSPVSNRLGFLSIGSREIAGGLVYIHPLGGDKIWSINLDIANLVLSDLVDGNTIADITSQSYSLGVSIGL